MNVITILWTISEYFLHTYFTWILPSKWCAKICGTYYDKQFACNSTLYDYWLQSEQSQQSQIEALFLISLRAQRILFFFLFYPKPDLCVFGLGSLYLRQFNFWLNNCSLTQRPRAIKKHWKHFLTLSHESGYLWGALLHGGLAQIRQELSK